jgi:hypothetical protein
VGADGGDCRIDRPPACRALRRVLSSTLPLVSLQLENTAIDHERLKHLQGQRALISLELTDAQCAEERVAELTKSLGLKLHGMRLMRE